MHHQHGGHDVVLWSAAAVIAAGPFIAIGMDRWHGWIFLGQRQGGTVAAERLLRLGLTVLALGAAAATVASRPGDPMARETGFGEWLMVGSLIAWAVGIASSHARWLPWLGVAFGAIVAVPSVASGDRLATGLAVAVAVGAAGLVVMRERLAAIPVSARSASLSLLVLGAGVVVLVSVTAVARL